MGENAERQLCISDFEIGKPLGKGKFGRVYVARERESTFVVALNVIPIEQLEKCKIHHQLRRGMAIQFSLKHPNVLRLYGWIHDSENAFLIPDCAHNGELYKELSRKGHFSAQQAATGRIKIADFGWSVQTRSKRQNMCETLDYFEPEIIENKAHDYAVDNWTLGILCYEFLYGAPQFEADSQVDTFKRIMKVDLSFPSTPYVSSEAKHLISRLRVKDSSRRLSLQRIMEYPWIIKNAKPIGVCS